MFELISYEKFRDTKDVRFFDISVNESNYRDLVIHSGPAVSPPNDEEFKNWQFYIHHNQEDNLLAISGGRTFFLVNFGWDYPFYKVRLESCGYILRIPPVRCSISGGGCIGYYNGYVFDITVSIDHFDWMNYINLNLQF